VLHALGGMTALAPRSGARMTSYDKP